MAAVKTLIGNIKGPKGDTGEKGDTGAKGDIGATGRRGSRWNSGTAITGTSTTATIFSGSGISDALVSDMYLNTSTGNTYRCTVSGAASVAKWVYVGNIKGAKGDTGAKGDKGDTGATGPQGPQGEYAAVDSALSATSTNPVQNKVVQAALSNKLGTTGDTKNNIVSFTSADSTSPTAWMDVAALASGEKHSSLFNKISTMFKNVRYLYKMLGTTDISGIGNGTVTGGLSALNSNSVKKSGDTINGTLKVTNGTNAVEVFANDEGGNINLDNVPVNRASQQDVNAGVYRAYLYQINPWQYLNDITIHPDKVTTQKDFVNGNGISLNSLSENLVDLVQQQSISNSSVTLGANADTTVSFTPTIPSGYKYLGALYINTNNGVITTRGISNINSSGVVNAVLSNRATSSVTTSATLYYLVIRA